MVVASSELDALVKQLVAIHGEGGVCPDADDWRVILSGPSDQPLTILNLLKFKPQVQTPEGVLPGASVYRRYSTRVAGAFARVGGKQVLFGKVGHRFGLLASPSVVGWDAAIVTRYPTPRALADFWLDPEFITAHAHRIDGIDQSQVLVLSGVPE